MVTLEIQKRLRRRYVDLDQPICNTRFVSFDLETTGFAPHGGDEVISIGAAILVGSELVSDRYFHQLINPGRPIPQVVSDLTGITDEMVCTKSDFVPVFREFLDFASDCIFLGHGVAFDLSFINEKLRRCLRSRVRVQSLVLDTRLLYQSVYPGLSQYTLDYLLQLHQIYPVGRHTALGDAILTAQVFRLLFSAFPKLGCFTLRQLCRIGELKTVGR